MAKFYLVEDHLSGGLFFVEDENDPMQEDYIEETCDECGDNDRIVGYFTNLQDGIKQIKHECRGSQEYANELIDKLKNLYGG